MDELARPADLAAVELHDRLVSQADAERRHTLAEPAQDRGRLTGVLRAGPGRGR